VIAVMTDPPSAWDTMAAWLDEKHKDEGDLWHRALIDPPLLRLLGPVAGQRVLEVAAGNGYLARKLARQGGHVTAIDASANLIALAQQREARDPLGIVYHVADAARSEMLRDGAFDVVVCNMALMDIEDAAGALGQAARVLRASGRFLASFSHPCFDVPGASAWVVERMDLTTTVWRKVSRYREVFQGWCPWRFAGPTGFHHTPAYHRPLSWYFRALRNAGLVVTALEEPAPTEELAAQSSQGEWLASVPLHVVIEAHKLTV
jgi:ubiquinone/menaquinone biosynthesis C-methylase UbiE